MDGGKGDLPKIDDLLKGATKRLNIHKVIIVGDGRVGKTSLLRRLRGDDFREDEPSTNGAEHCSVILNNESSWKQVEAGEGDVGSTALASIF